MSKISIKDAIRIASDNCLMPPLSKEEQREAARFFDGKRKIADTDQFDRRFNILERERAKKMVGDV